MQEFISLKNIIVHVVAPSINGFTFIYMWIKLFNIKNPLKNYKIYLATLAIFIIGIINNEFIPQKYKIIIFSIFSLLIVINFFESSMEKAINSVITAQSIAMVSEILTVLILSLIIKSKDITTFLQTNKGFLTINLLVSIVIFLFTWFKLSRCIYNLLCKITNVIKKRRLIIYTLLLIFAANILTHIAYNKFNIIVLVIINTILIIVYALITYYTIKTDNKYQKIYNKYNLSLDTLRENESLLDDYKMYSHENDNTLKTIRNMIETNDKNVLNYINTVIKDKESHDEGIISKTSIIPISGLKALLYSKIKDMKKLEIGNELYVDKSIKSSDLINIDDETLLDVCKIIGVFIDNAIEATKDLETKQIDISLYNEQDNIIIEVANTFSGNINIDKIAKKGFTTKGGKHGYGLSLVNTILEHNKKLNNTKQINNNIFIQTLEIKK